MHKNRRIRALIAKVLLGTLVLMSLAVFPSADNVTEQVSLDAQPAAAGQPIVYRQAGNHWTPMLGCPACNVVRVWMEPGEQFKMECWLDLSYATTGNYSSRRWFAGWAWKQGKWGYVHSSYVYYQVNVPRC